MKPVALSDLEAHLITAHGVDPERISASAERTSDKDTREVAADLSHQLMHALTPDLTHSHE